MAISLCMSEKDRALYGGEEWVTLDHAQLADMDYEQLAALERPMRKHDDISLAKLLGVEWPDKTVLGIRGALWLALRLSGAEKLAWEDFKPNTMNVDFKVVDAVPPTGGSSEPPSAKGARSKKDSTS